MNSNAVRIIVVGSINTDIIGYQVDRLLGPGELAVSGRLVIGPGGKSRNMAQMASALLGKGRIAMIGKTARDPFGLWKPPVEALRRHGVNTSFLHMLDHRRTGVFPGIALIPVDRLGENQIYALPGANALLSPADIDRAAPLFRAAARNSGVLMLSLELPARTGLHAIRNARRHGLRVVLDPGGMTDVRAVRQILKQEIELFKPNEHEARMLTGIRVTDAVSAERAGRKLLASGIRNVLITHGAKGAYLISRDHGVLGIRPPLLKAGKDRDATGCGDQVTATAAVLLALGRGIEEAARAAIVSGTLQYYRSGIVPVTKKELGRTMSGLRRRAFDWESRPRGNAGSPFGAHL